MPPHRGLTHERPVNHGLVQDSMSDLIPAEAGTTEQRWMSRWIWLSRESFDVLFVRAQPLTRRLPESGGLAKEAVDYGGSLDANATSIYDRSAHRHAKRAHGGHVWAGIAEVVGNGMSPAGLGLHVPLGFGR